MKKASQWIFGFMLAVALSLLMHCCYAYEGESEEDWVNRMWYDTQWVVAKTADTSVIGRTVNFARLLGDYTGYSDVMPWIESGRIHFLLNGEAPCSIEIVTGGGAIMYDENGTGIFGFINMAAKRNR